jgi:multicomponent K+:H+ antiporter subunit E
MGMPPKTPARLASHPVMSLLMAACWLLLQQSLDPVPQLIAATVLALVLPRLLHGFLGTASPAARAGQPRCASPASCCGTSWCPTSRWRGWCSTRAAKPQPAWVPVPLDSRTRWHHAAGASVITTTPGTVSCVVDEARGEILVHALDCSDPAGMAATSSSATRRR